MANPFDAPPLPGGPSTPLPAPTVGTPPIVGAQPPAPVVPASAPAPTPGYRPSAAPAPLSPLDTLGQLVSKGFGTSVDLSFAPVKAAATILGHIPLGWVPGGADEQFDQFGKALAPGGEKADPNAYKDWLTVKAAADGDVLGGGNLKSDFNHELTTKLDEQLQNTQLGLTPELGSGMSYGSFGAAIQGTVMGALNVQSALVQRGIAGSAAGAALPQAVEVVAQEILGSFNPTRTLLDISTESQATAVKKLYADLGKNRVEGLQQQDPATLSDIERTVVDNVNSGKWSVDHGHDYLVTHNQAYSKDFATQMLLQMTTDPLTYETVGAGYLSKLGLTTGSKLLETGTAAQTMTERIALRAAQVQQGPGGTAARITRSLIDPFAAMGHSSATEGLKNIMSTDATSAFRRAYGESTYEGLWKTAGKHGFTDKLNSAVGGYTASMGRGMVAKDALETNLKANLGEALIHQNPDEVIAPLLGAAPRDAFDNLTEYIAKRAHNVFTPADNEQLAGRLAAWTGRTKEEWAADVKLMSRDEKSAWHALTYNGSGKEFQEALAQVDREAYHGAGGQRLPLDQLELLNPNNLDNVGAQEILTGLNAATGDLEKAAIWNEAASRYSRIAELGRATGGSDDMSKLQARLQDMLDGHELHARATNAELGHHSLQPVRDFLSRHTIEGERLWNVGFRPSEDVAFGLRRHPVTGGFIVEHDPTISHVFDVAPAQQPYAEVTRNVLGQVIGKKAAGAVGRPVEAIETFLRTGFDNVTGRRLADNISKRFEARMVEIHGLTAKESRDLMTAAEELARFNKTTIRGLSGDNLWEHAEQIIPLEMRGRVDRHVLMDELLRASEGDLRIMGTGNNFTQRVRTLLHRAGDHSNWSGQMTVTQYSKLRFFQPTFLVQRLTDAPFYLALQGVMPVGRTMYDPALRETAVIMRNMGKSGLGRDLAVDLPEYSTMSQMQESIWKNAVKKSGLQGRLEAVANAPDAYIRNNMTKMLHEDLGNILRESVDEARLGIKELAKTDPSLAAEMSKSMDRMELTFADIRRVMSENAGRPLSEQDTGLKYVQEQFASQARQSLSDEGALSLRRVAGEADIMMPNGYGEVRPLYLDDVAKEFNLADEAALRTEIDKRGQAWARDYLTNQVHAHPDFVTRAMDALNFRWEPFWANVEAVTGMTPELSREVQGVIARSAQLRGLDPHEYLSQVMKTNLAGGDLSAEMGKLTDLLRATKENKLEDVVRVYRGHMDASQQRVLVDHFRIEMRGPNGLIARAVEAGDPQRAAELRNIADTLERGAGTARVPGAPATYGESLLGPEARRTMAPQTSQAVSNALDEFGRQFPDVPLIQFEIDPNFHIAAGQERAAGHALDTQAQTVGWEVNRGAGEAAQTKVLVSPEYFGANADTAWGKSLEVNNKGWVEHGRPVTVSATPEGAARHEAGHALDKHIEQMVNDPELLARDPAARKAAQAYMRDMKIMAKNGDDISFYAGQNRDEFAGEMYDLAYGPEADLQAYLGKLAASEHAGPDVADDVAQWVADYKALVEDTGLYHPNAPVREVPVQSAIAAQGEAYNAAFDAAFADNIAQRAAGRVFENPEVEAAAEHFSKWTQGALMHSPARISEGVATMVRNIPVDKAFAYNHTEALVKQLLRQKIGLAEVDAYRLAEMATKRNVFSRSLNHPVFGMYPASYMYGKVLPEALKFFARNPYSATYQIIDVERAIAIQREFDPQFADAQGTLDNSEMAYLAGYLTPSLPWEDMSARPGPWAQQFARHGFDPAKMAEAEWATISPERWYKSMGGALHEAGSFVQSDLGQPTEALPTRGTPQPPPAEAPTGQPNAPITFAQPTAGANLAPVLGKDMEDLQRLFSP